MYSSENSSYHFELNPIDLIWAELKKGAGAKNTKFKMKCVEVLLVEEMKNGTPGNWRKAVEHVKSEKDRFSELNRMRGELKSFVNCLEKDDCSEAKLSGVDTFG